ncbi:MAG: hypothetical protein K1X53_05960 [Candidatus Sumerlaeaceae bacterium]|nr:hypothetical protein [Candidatus Sumerlaeaceae bacterium]
MNSFLPVEARWVRLMSCLPPGWVTRLNRQALAIPYALSLFPGEKERIADLFRGYLKVTSQSGDPADLARKNVSVRLLQKYAAPLVSVAPEAKLADLVNVVGEEHFLNAHARGRGVVIVSAHFGSGGLAAAWIARKGIRVLTLRRTEWRDPKRSSVASFAFFGTEPMFLDWSESPVAVLKRGADALRQNAVISYLADGEFGERYGKASLFGRPVPIRTGLVHVAASVGAAVVPAISLITRAGLRTQFFPEIAVDSPEGVQAFPQAFASILEKGYKNHPECISWHPFETRLFTGRAWRLD